ncbi:MAG TPA: hypothetical protein VFJ90_00105 [Candidatus Didemnitutus sp.]|nr:hypothetical protein [Candidatus Didemnitutus sp.]
MSMPPKKSAKKRVAPSNQAQVGGVEFQRIAGKILAERKALLHVLAQ